ncbi:competence protein ComYD [Enterococcus florum]|uniref:Competence protein ComYD n=1 Tax=Enterococcus florum TaxID=2480627 RepID=A0A4P5PBF2_9ENTE|nr:competence protein ComYD [Enterococcus florum]
MIEALLVLLVVSTFILLPTLAMSSWQQTLEKRFFYYQLDKSILHLQQLAIANQTSTRIDLYPDKQVIVFFTNREVLPWREMKLPKPVVLTGEHSIRFKAKTGNVSSTQPGTGIPNIRFKEGQTTVLYQFQLGSGRFEKK